FPSTLFPGRTFVLELWGLIQFAAPAIFHRSVKLIFETIHLAYAWGLSFVGSMIVVTSAVAQIVDTARISGMIHDASGGRIPGAKVSLRSETTGLSSSLHSNSAGLYITPPLPPGAYELKVQATGFSSLIQHIRLEVAQRASVD